MCGNSSSFWSWAPRLALALLFFFSSILPLQAQEQTGSVQTGNQPQEERSRKLLMKIDALLAGLEPRLAERSMQAGELQESLKISEGLLAELRNEIKSLKASLESAQGSQAESQKDLEEMRSSYDKLEKLYANLLQAWESYQVEMQAQKTALELERNKAQSAADLLPWIAIGSFILGAAAGVGFMILVK